MSNTPTVVEHGCASSHLSFIEELYVFFTGSTKRYAVLNQCLEWIANALQLLNLSKTCWTVRAESIQAVWSSYDGVFGALKEIFSSISDSKVQAQACGLLKKVACIDFIMVIIFMKDIMLKPKYWLSFSRGMT